jgi:hypothetical protein
MRKLPALVLLLMVALLAACASGPPKRVFPPQVSLQELQVGADGQWLVNVRVQNFSTVAMDFSQLQATLMVGGQEAARIDFDPRLKVGPASIEVVQYRLTPGAGAQAAVAQSLASRRSVRYQLSGSIASREPKSEHPFDYQSALDPVPGLAGVLR